MAIDQKEWSKETKQNIALSVLVIAAAAVLFALL